MMCVYTYQNHAQYCTLFHSADSFHFSLQHLCLCVFAYNSIHRFTEIAMHSFGSITYSQHYLVYVRGRVFTFVYHYFTCTNHTNKSFETVTSSSSSYRVSSLFVCLFVRIQYVFGSGFHDGIALHTSTCMCNRIKKRLCV